MTGKAWQTYEEVAAYLLDSNAKEFGLEKVEGKQTVAGQLSGTNWEIDAKGINDNGEGFVIIECRQHKSRLNQEQTAALAYRITDTGASGGIMVSPLGLQSGAKKVASAGRILKVTLAADSTPHEFAMRFLNKLMIGLSDDITVTDKLTITHHRVCKLCGNEFEVHENEEACPECLLINTT